MINKLQINNIGKTFDSDKGRKVMALDNVQIDVNAGEFVCIIGSSGCGKTTLLRVIDGLESMDNGSVIIDGKSLNLKKKVSTLVFQQYSLFPWLNIEQNIAFPLELRSMSKNIRLAEVGELLALVGLSDCRGAYPYELSGGMQQRAAIARALAYDPEILLMDEPFGALDERTRNRLQDMMLKICSEKKKTIIFVTHNIDEAIVLSDRVIVMASEPGRIVEEIKVGFSKPRNRMSKNFIKLHLQLRNILDTYE